MLVLIYLPIHFLSYFYPPAFIDSYLLMLVLIYLTIYFLPYFYTHALILSFLLIFVILYPHFIFSLIFLSSRSFSFLFINVGSFISTTSFSTSFLSSLFHCFYRLILVLLYLPFHFLIYFYSPLLLVLTY